MLYLYAKRVLVKMIDTMHIGEYKKMFLLEDSYWWYQGAHRILLNQVKKYTSKETRPTILDAGCGTGGALNLIKDFGRIVAIDISEHALAYVRMRNKTVKLVQADLLHLPLGKETLDCIVSFDALYCLGDDLKAIEEFRRVLKKSAVLILNLPAYNCLYSKHDAAVFTKRRYNRKRFTKILLNSNFKIEKATYWNTFLFPFEALFRLLTKFYDRKNSSSDLYRLPQYINYVLTRILFFEEVLLKNINFPFGLSLLVIARKE